MAGVGGRVCSSAKRLVVRQPAEQVREGQAAAGSSRQQQAKGLAPPAYTTLQACPLAAAPPRPTSWCRARCSTPLSTASTSMPASAGKNWQGARGFRSKRRGPQARHEAQHTANAPWALLGRCRRLLPAQQRAAAQFVAPEWMSHFSRNISIMAALGGGRSKRFAGQAVRQSVQAAASPREAALLPALQAAFTERLVQRWHHLPAVKASGSGQRWLTDHCSRCSAARLPSPAQHGACHGRAVARVARGWHSLALPASTALFPHPSSTCAPAPAAGF